MAENQIETDSDIESELGPIEAEYEQLGREVLMGLGQVGASILSGYVTAQGSYIALNGGNLEAGIIACLGAAMAYVGFRLLPNRINNCINQMQYIYDRNRKEQCIPDLSKLSWSGQIGFYVYMIHGASVLGLH